MEIDFNREDIEKMLLKRAFVDKKWMNILAGTFDRRFFKTPNMGLIADLVVRYYNKYGSPPSTKVLSSICKAYADKHSNEGINPGSVNELIAEVNSFDMQVQEDVASDVMKDFIRKNAFYNALYDNADMLGRDEDSYAKVVEKCLENFDKVQKITFNDTALGMEYFDPAAMEEHWKYIQNPESKISTGFPSIDVYTHGGFLKDGRSLYLVMAQAGLGKSLFLSNLAKNFLEQGLKVVVISLEMSEDVYAQRFDAHISGDDINKLNVTSQSSIASIKKFYSEHPTASLFIKEYPPKSVTCNDIRAYLDNLKLAGHSFDVLIVDYLNLVKSSIRSDSLFVDGLDVSEKLRAISYEFKIPVISAIQTNREGMNNADAGMENISQSSGIAFTADFLMSMYRTQEDRQAGMIMGRILKNRLGGKVGEVVAFRLNDSNLLLEDTSPRQEDDEDIAMNSLLASASGMAKDISSLQTSNDVLGGAELDEL
jgi:replicative DNA helicase